MSVTLAEAIGFARRRPGATVAAVLGVHLIVWTLLPILINPNLPLDLAEGLALGKEWQLGYWKHPPLPWWITDLIYRITGEVNAVYALGPLASTLCMLAVWLLARDIVGPVQALIATFALEGIHFYNFSAVKFAHDQMQLSVWALAALFLYRGIVHGRAYYWMLAGVMVALAFWTKYSAVAFAVSIGLFLLFDPDARRAWATPGPYLMGLAFALVIAPHLVWLVANDFTPFVYPSLRARVAESGLDYVIFPIRWIGAQLFFLLPAIGLLALAYPRPKPSPETGLNFAGRYVTMLALGPFVFVTLMALVLGRLPVLLWGYPLWSFLPLAIVVWLGADIDAARQRMFTIGFLVIFVGMAVSYGMVPILEALFRDRIKAVDFPGRSLAEELTRIWHGSVKTPLQYITGDELPAYNVAVFSPDRPKVVVQGALYSSPWINVKDLQLSGVMIIWTEGLTPKIVFDFWKLTFPGFDPLSSHAIDVPRPGWRPGPPLRMRYAIISPMSPGIAR